MFSLPLPTAFMYSSKLSLETKFQTPTNISAIMYQRGSAGRQVLNVDSWPVYSVDKPGLTDSNDESEALYNAIGKEFLGAARLDDAALTFAE